MSCVTASGKMVRSQQLRTGLCTYIWLSYPPFDMVGDLYSSAVASQPCTTTLEICRGMTRVPI